jgi:hypothetical protein
MDQNALREEHRQGGYQIRLIHQHSRRLPFGDTPRKVRVTKSDSYRNGAASVLLSGHPLNPLKTGA